MFDIKTRSMIEGSEIGEVCVGEVTTWEHSSVLLYKMSSWFARVSRIEDDDEGGL